VVIRQSRGGELARVLAVGNPDAVVMLGSPVLEPLSAGIVSWRACLDPDARHVEVESSHAGMSVNRAVYRVLAEFLEEEPAWSG